MNSPFLQTTSKLTPTDLRHSVRRFRKRPAHGVHISPVQTTIVYVTICCENRRPWLATEYHQKLLVDIWKDNSHWTVGRYVLMPDHLHLFASPQPSAVDFDSWAIFIKSQFSKNNLDKTCVWQTDHWDTRIRSFRHYEERTLYMVNNPVRAGTGLKLGGLAIPGVIHELRWD